MSKRPRWVLAGLPVLAAMAVAAVLRLNPPATAGPPSALPGLTACAAVPAVGPAIAARPGSWWKLAPQLDVGGALAGQRLFVGHDGAASASADLPAESSVSGPVDGVVVIAQDDGSRSRLRIASTATGCASDIAELAGVVRRAILVPSDGSVLVHLVERVTRADRGIWRVAAPGATVTPPAEASAALAAVLEPLDASRLGLGPVWATDLRLDPTGGRLAVQSCFERGCLTRIVDLRRPGRAPLVIRDADQGALIGFSGDQLVSWSVCEGYPCAIQAWDATTGKRTELVPAAVAAGLSGDGRHLVAIVADPSGSHAILVELATGRMGRTGGLAAMERPLIAGALATAGLEVAADEIPVAAPNADPRAYRPEARPEVIP